MWIVSQDKKVTRKVDYIQEDGKFIQGYLGENDGGQTVAEYSDSELTEKAKERFDRAVENGARLFRFPTNLEVEEM